MDPPGAQPYGTPILVGASRKQINMQLPIVIRFNGEAVVTWKEGKQTLNSYQA